MIPNGAGFVRGRSLAECKDGTGESCILHVAEDAEKTRLKMQVAVGVEINLGLQNGGTGDAEEGRPMRKLEALLPAMTADAIVDELRTLDIENLVTTHVSVMDKEHPHKMIYRGCVYDQPFGAPLKVEVSVSDEDAERAEALLGLCVAH
jgi:hypothetical protein